MLSRNRSQKPVSPIEWTRMIGWSLIALMAISLMFGGGGVGRGLTNLLVQLVALGILLFTPGALRHFVSTAPKPLLILVGLTLALPLIQLLPLPAGLWQSLPGRDMAVESRELVGAGDDWFPITLDRARTLTAVLALIGPLAVLTAVFGRKLAQGRHILLLLVGLALANFLFGALQFATSSDALILYGSRSDGRFYGFFANHNSSGLLMVIGLCAMVGFYADKPRRATQSAAMAFVAMLLVIGVVLTNSRSSTALLLLPLAWIGWLILKELAKVEARKRWTIIGAGVLGIAAVGALVATNDRLGATWERYGDLEDSRPDIWADTANGIDRYWPVGSGMGTFDEVFQVEESLETLVAGRAGRAHNEYLEIVLEAGIVGGLLVIGWGLYLLFATWRGLRSVHAPVTLAAAMASACIALQALLDLPLRNMALLCVAGLLVALLSAPLSTKRD